MIVDFIREAPQLDRLFLGTVPKVVGLGDGGDGGDQSAEVSELGTSSHSRGGRNVSRFQLRKNEQQPFASRLAGSKY